MMPKAPLDRLVIALYRFDIQQDEVWREINYLQSNHANERYFISNYGYVVSLCRDTPIILQPFLCGEYGKQYYCVSIGGKNQKIHRLVAEAFIPNPQNKPIVHHKDHNKYNNHYTNLEWTTSKENSIAYQQFKNSDNQTV